MLVVGRIDVRHIDFFNIAYDRIGVTAEDLDHRIESAEDGPLYRYVTENPRKRILIGPPELAEARVPVLIEPLEDAGGVRVDRGLRQERGDEERVQLLRHLLDQRQRGIEIAGVARGKETTLTRADGTHLLGCIELIDEAIGHQLSLEMG